MNYDADKHVRNFSIFSSLSWYRMIACVYIFSVNNMCQFIEKKKKKRKKGKSTVIKLGNTCTLVWGQTKSTVGEYVTSHNLGTFCFRINVINNVNK